MKRDFILNFKLSFLIPFFLNLKINKSTLMGLKYFENRYLTKGALSANLKFKNEAELLRLFIFMLLIPLHDI